MLNSDELEAVDSWRFQHHMPSRAAAVRALLNIGLGTVTQKADPNMRSQDFGLLGKNTSARETGND